MRVFHFKSVLDRKVKVINTGAKSSQWPETQLRNSLCRVSRKSQFRNRLSNMFPNLLVQSGKVPFNSSSDSVYSIHPYMFSVLWGYRSQSPFNSSITLELHTVWFVFRSIHFSLSSRCYCCQVASKFNSIRTTSCGSPPINSYQIIDCIEYPLEPLFSRWRYLKLLLRSTKIIFIKYQRFYCTNSIQLQLLR